eukprot:597578-Pelagomonas_calceolata.AAC.2
MPPAASAWTPSAWRTPRTTAAPTVSCWCPPPAWASNPPPSCIPPPSPFSVQYISGAILFEETLYQTCSNGKKMSDMLSDQGIVPGIKVDKGLAPLANSNDEQWCMGLDGLDKRCAEYYKAGARFAKWRSVVSIPNGPSTIAVRDCAYGLARYAAIAQNAGLVPIVEPEVLLDGEQTIERTLEVAEAVWAETFKYMADNKVCTVGSDVVWWPGEEKEQWQAWQSCRGWSTCL